MKIIFFILDINECENKDNNCTQLCHNIDGGYYCACEDGYRLSTDSHTCTGALRVPTCNTTVSQYSNIIQFHIKYMTNNYTDI